MSTSERGAQTLIETKRSWKLPGVYVAASVLLVILAAVTSGDVRIILNDKSQSYVIPEIVTAGAPIVWGLAVIAIAAAAWSLVTTARRMRTPSWARIIVVVLVGLSTDRKSVV